MSRPDAFALVVLTVSLGCGQKPVTPRAPEPLRPPGAADPAARSGEPEPKADDSKAEAATRLRQIGKALHAHESTVGQFPAGVVGPKGERGLSWRVQLLPYRDDKAAIDLYKQFKQDEPWDSETNKKLIEKMPAVFASPGKEAVGKTYLRSFVGEAAFIPVPHRGFVPGSPAAKAKAPPPFERIAAGLPAPASRMSSVTDGTSNTLMVVEAAEAVEWTKPDELAVPGFVGGPQPIPVPKLGGVFPGGFHGLMYDGAVHFFPANLKEETLRAMITTNGGEVLGPDATTILFPPRPKKPAPPSAVPESLADAAARRTAVANYQKILKGLHDHSDTMGQLPAGIVGPDAAKARTVGLSWRVQVLPLIGEDKLYAEFKLTEAWDSDHNKKLLERMPTVFASPGKPAEKGHTFVRTTVGPGGIIRTTAGPRGELVIPIQKEHAAGTPVRALPFPAAFPDETSNTILFLEAGPAVPWTKPDELMLGPLTDPFGKGGPPQTVKLPPLGGVFADGFHAVMADGRVSFYQADYPAVEVGKLLCPNDARTVEPLGEPEKIRYSVPPALGKPVGKPFPDERKAKSGLVKPR